MKLWTRLQESGSFPLTMRWQLWKVVMIWQLHGHLVVFVISNFLQIAIFTNHSSTLNFPLLQYGKGGFLRLLFKLYLITSKRAITWCCVCYEVYTRCTHYIYPDNTFLWCTRNFLSFWSCLPLVHDSEWLGYILCRLRGGGLGEHSGEWSRPAHLLSRSTAHRHVLCNSEAAAI